MQVCLVNDFTFHLRPTPTVLAANFGCDWFDSKLFYALPSEVAVLFNWNLSRHPHLHWNIWICFYALFLLWAETNRNLQDWSKRGGLHGSGTSSRKIHQNCILYKKTNFVVSAQNLQKDKKLFEKFLLTNYVGIARVAVLCPKAGWSRPAATAANSELSRKHPVFVLWIQLIMQTEHCRLANWL